MKRSLTILLTIALLFTSIPTVRTAAEEDGFIDDSLQTLETIVEETEEPSEEQEGSGLFYTGRISKIQG